MRQRVLGPEAFTFLEVLFTVVIIAVGIIAIMNWVPVSIQTKTKVERKTTAIFLAQEKLDEIAWSVLYNFGNDFNQATPQAFGAPYNNFYWTAASNDETGWSLKTLSVSTWHADEPGNKVIFDTQVAPR